jgi:hypothetical protein
MAEFATFAGGLLGSNGRWLSFTSFGDVLNFAGTLDFREWWSLVPIDISNNLFALQTFDGTVVSVNKETGALSVRDGVVSGDEVFKLTYHKDDQSISLLSSNNCYVTCLLNGHVACIETSATASTRLILCKEVPLGTIGDPTWLLSIPNDTTVGIWSPSTKSWLSPSALHGIPGIDYYQVVCKDVTKLGLWERWHFQLISNSAEHETGVVGRRSIKAGFLSDHNRYLSAEPSGKVVADKKELIVWETFTLQPSGSGSITFKTQHNNGKDFLSTSNNSKRLHSNANHVSNNERFYLVANPVLDREYADSNPIRDSNDHISNAVIKKKKSALHNKLVPPPAKIAIKMIGNAVISMDAVLKSTVKEISSYVPGGSGVSPVAAAMPDSNGDFATKSQSGLTKSSSGNASFDMIVVGASTSSSHDHAQEQEQQRAAASSPEVVESVIDAASQFLSHESERLSFPSTATTSLADVATTPSLLDPSAYPVASPRPESTILSSGAALPFGASTAIWDESRDV